MLATILLVLFVPVCILLILIVLLQAGKGGGLAGAFGGAGGQTFLGARGAADFLGKLTIYLAVAFMLMALVLSFTYGRQGTINIREDTAVEETTETPAGDTVPAQAEPTAETGQTQAQPASGTSPSEGN